MRCWEVAVLTIVAAVVVAVVTAPDVALVAWEWWRSWS